MQVFSMKHQEADGRGYGPFLPEILLLDGEIILMNNYCHGFLYPENTENAENNRVTRQIAFGSSTGGAGPLPVITTLLADPINVVSTAIDTVGMRDVTNLLIFTSIISLPLGISVTLNFQITRTNGDGSSIKVGPTHTFSTLATALEAESFAFQFADSNLRPGNYTYSVEISTNSVIDITPGLTVNNATLSVIGFND